MRAFSDVVCRVKGVGCRVKGAGCRVKGVACRVKGVVGLGYLLGQVASCGEGHQTLDEGV